MPDNTLPFKDPDADRYVDLPIAPAERYKMRLLGSVREPHLRTHAYYEHDGATWKTDADDSHTATSWRESIGRSERPHVALDALSASDQDRILEATKDLRALYRLSGDVVLVRSYGPALMTEWNGMTGRPKFKVVDLEPVFGLSRRNFRLASLVVDAMEPGIADSIKDILPDAAVDLTDLETFGREESTDEAAPIGAELSLWSLEQRTRHSPMGQVASIRTLVETKRFLERRWSDIGVDWGCAHRPDMEMQLYDKPLHDERALLDAVKRASAGLEQGDPYASRMMALAAQRLHFRLERIADPEALADLTV